MQQQSSIHYVPSKALRIGLWVAQVAAFGIYVFSGITKFTTPIPELSQMMPWTGQYSENFVRFIGLVDLAGGIGILLPSLTRILPKLTVLAALGCTVLQILAIAFHASRDEFMVLPFNAVLISLSIFVLWGRHNKAQIAAR
ncbi:DoxX family protein [Methylophilus sp. DW102]|jgi:uncharacterized membrane protein|uniref:DoxX family protein n=1 Tax=Methylophilus sp. DW102 TaxID=3095607 RepID=UPI0030910BAD|nr:DoxX family protein [Methylophilus sp. DW102]